MMLTYHSEGVRPPQQQGMPFRYFDVARQGKGTLEVQSSQRAVFYRRQEDLQISAR